MKSESQFGIKYWLLSCLVGIVVFVLLSFLVGNAAVEPAADFLVWPGMSLATLMGFGAHDLQGLVLYFLGNVFFYCGVFLVLFRLLKIGK
jgi:hypothetical protein